MLQYKGPESKAEELANHRATTSRTKNKCKPVTIYKAMQCKG
jgi:hypothetical protein